MDRLDAAVLTLPTLLARIDVLEREIAAGLLRGVATAAEYRTINNIMARQHAEARVFAIPPPTRP
jgi:hypothetical protein